MHYKSVLFICATLLCATSHAEREVSLLDTPGKSAQARYDITQIVNDELLLSTYILSENTAGFSNAAMLREKAREGKRVSLLSDHFAAGHGPSRALLKALQTAGVDVGIYHVPEFLRPFRYFRRLHDKLLIVDGQHLITGDRNLSNEYFGLEQSPWKGMDIYINDKEQASTAGKYFHDLFESEHVTRPVFGAISKKLVKAADAKMDKAMEYLRAEPIAKDPELRFRWRDNDKVVADSARFLHFNVKDIENPRREPTRILALAGEAQESLDIVTPYFVPPKELMAVLQRLLDRKVKVRVLTNSRKSNNQPMAQKYYEANFDHFVKMGLELWEYQGPETLHAKILRVDGKLSAVGSLNGDAISFHKNTESGLVVTSQDFGKVLGKSLDKEFFSKSTQVAVDKKSLVPGRTCSALMKFAMGLLRDEL